MRRDNPYTSNIRLHSFIIRNYSPTVDFGLYHSEEGPPDVANAGISVNILQPGVRISISYPQATLNTLTELS